MSNYLGSDCIVCGRKFDENDDIVVCPECGTPYHRECYMQSGECVNKELHLSGRSWWESSDSTKDNTENKKCPQCGNINKPHSIICESCGFPLVDELNERMGTKTSGHGLGGTDNVFEEKNFNNVFNADMKYCGIDPEEKFDSVRLADLAEFVNTNRIYYLPIFKRIKDSGRKISLNFIAFLFPQIYFANRKMWFWSAVSIVLSAVLDIPYIIYNMIGLEMSGTLLNSIDIYSDQFKIIFNAANILNMIFKIIMFIFSNWMYYRYSVNKIRKIKSIDDNPGDFVLSAKGGTSTLFAVIAALIQVLLTSVVMYIMTM